tara:strand:+ start:383 stop:1363 length:981 start_codon:yes stop_codon:yes gene_type:complete
MPILCRVTRGELTESIHVGFAAAVDERGEVFYSTGDAQHLTCIRSALKPFQAAAAIESGAIDSAGFNSKELALMCASHNGEKIHLNTLGSMLEKTGFLTEHLKCGSHMPLSSLVRKEMLIQGIEPNARHNNCSGKHAGMLAFAKYLEEDFVDYTNKNHAVQERIMTYVKTLLGSKKIPLEIDGCSAPTPFLTIGMIATLFQKLGSGQKEELDRVFNAMVENPLIVGGEKNFDTKFIESLKGSGVTKVGGESVRGITIKTKNRGCIGLAIKILDGNFRVLPIATIKLLEHLELLDEVQIDSLSKFKNKKIMNHNGDEVGRIEAHIEF